MLRIKLSLSPVKAGGLGPAHIYIYRIRVFGFPVNIILPLLITGIVLFLRFYLEPHFKILPR
jgi:hypothetical protein